MSVSAAELALIQADLVENVCDKTCEIWNPGTTTPGSAGEPIKSYTLAETTVAGMAQPTAGELQNYDYVIGDKAAWTVHLPIGTNAGPQSHLIIEGQTLEVHVELTPQSYPGLLSVIAAKIK